MHAGAKNGGSLGDERLAEALAARTLELLEPILEELAAGRTADALVDAATVGRELGVSRQFVYDHAEELGGLRLGSGRRPRLRFELATARRAWHRIADDRARVQEPLTPRASRGARPAGFELLPVRGRPVR